MELPRGFRFIPSDGDLIYFLNEKVNLGKTTCQFLGECDMYGNKEPWEIWNDHGGLNVKKGEDLYLFTKLKKVSVNGKRINRRVGSGTWSGANCGEVVEGVGEKRHFRYENNGGRDHGAWIMHEYTLLHNNHHRAHGDNEYVLCRLRRKINEDCGRERKRRKLKISDNNNNIIQENPLSSSRISVFHEEDHHHNQHQPTQSYHHQETMSINNPIQKVGDLFPKDDEADKLMEYYLNLNEQEQWSSSNGTGGAAADHLNNISIQVEQQDDRQRRDDNNNTNNPISVNDLIDWGVVFEDDDELKEITIWDDEFRIHEKSSSSSTAGAEILLEDHQEAGQQDKDTIKSSISDDHEVVVEDEGLDKFAEKLEDILGLEIDVDHDDLMEISRDDFQAHIDHDHDHQVEADQQHINYNEDEATNKSTSSINDDHVVIVEDDHQDHDEALDKFVENLEDILELEIDHDDHDLMELRCEDIDFQAHMDHHDHQMERDQQQHTIVYEAEEEVKIDEDDINNIDGMYFAQELQKVPLYFAELPPDDQLEDILDDDFFNF
ncbi:hypothetical protein FEM48_Zijuj03G0037700 [Ziziphus jujuba var. spinosa]|uniref:NAC domain-containing protein n=1 Tax=Ziziphus jujuba var. spinosa TaxID=714518 RepID=A0A978VMZ7_ZIZJJ|nr:hypothetical protein FEM48_Zijuj03G0037700 [Ziziphus jujuba var. spinosa]